MPTTLDQNPWAVEKGAVQKESNAGWATGLAGGTGFLPRLKAKFWRKDADNRQVIPTR